MAKAQSQVEDLGAIVGERWVMAATEARRFAGENLPRSVNSGQIVAIRDAIEELAVRLVFDVFSSEEPSLEKARDHLLQAVQEELCAWALSIELGRIDRRAGQAA